MQGSLRKGLHFFLHLCALAAMGIHTQEVLAHAERPAFFPVNRVQARPEYRPLLDAAGNPTPQQNRLVVCKKAGDEGVGVGQDSASLIKKIKNPGLRKANEQLLSECRFEHLQAAVDAVTKRGSTIYILPGLYREQPSIRALEQNFGAKTAQDKAYCQAVLARGKGELSYQEQFRCPHIQNTVAIFGDPNYMDDACGTSRQGKCEGDPKTLTCDITKSECQYYNLQIEGTGEKVTDVVFEGDFVNKPGDVADGAFRYLNGVRGDRTDGLYLRNFTTQIFEFNAVYVMETDGYVFDTLLSRWVDEYAFLSFASDHGLYDNVEGYGVADSVAYPGSGADIYPTANHNVDLRKRQATEIRNSRGHHAALGYSGTAGNAPWVHNNAFYKNQTGMATESLFGGHPGMPQDHALFENNLIYSNNKDYYKYVTDGGPCVAKKPRDRGVVPPELTYFDTLPSDHQEAIMDRTIICPPIPFPTGTGIIIAGGNYDVVQNNQIFDNWRQGIWLISMPTLVHMINDPYAARPIPKNVIQALPAPLGGIVDTANSSGAAFAQAAQTGGLQLLLQQPLYTSHYNWFKDNRLAENAMGPKVFKQPNGVDFWWDGSGKGNCWKGNTSATGKVTQDTDPVKGMPTDCQDGDYSNTVDQLTTAYPPRILQYLPCLTYSRSDPSSKEFCPFFTVLSAPAGREGSAYVTAVQPSDGSRVVGQNRQVGYFVLHNEQGVDHTLKTVKVQVTGGIDAFKNTVVSINGVSSAAPTVEGDVLTYTFAAPAFVEKGTAVLAEVLMKTDAAPKVAEKTSALKLAGLGGGGVLGLFLLMGGIGRRQKALLFAAAVALVLVGCNDNSGSSSVATTASGTPVTPAEVTPMSGKQLKLVDLGFAAGAAQYAGLPLLIGSGQ